MTQAAKYATHEERLDARRATYRRSTDQRYSAYKDLCHKYGLKPRGGSKWSAHFVRLRDDPVTYIRQELGDSDARADYLEACAALDIVPRESWVSHFAEIWRLVGMPAENVELWKRTSNSAKRWVYARFTPAEAADIIGGIAP